MKKYKRLLSLVCAVCMALSLVIPASAADVSEGATLSEFAGTTITCQVVHGTFSGGTDRVYTIDVPIPANATKDEQDALVRNAAYASTNVAAPRFNWAGQDLISSKSYIAIPHSTSEKGGIGVGGGLLLKDYSTLYVQFDGVSPVNGASVLNIRVENDRFENSNVYTSGDIRLGNYPTTIYMIEGRFYGDGTFYMGSTDTITVWASTNVGYANVNTVYISASV